jgi:hypothetical protein
MHLLSLAADGLWILALAIMASVTRTAWRRMTPETRVPLQFHKDGRPAWRLKRDAALILPIAAAFLFGLALLWGHRSVTEASYEVIFFGLRATLAAMIALLHLQWLKQAVAALEAEGELTP